LLRHKEARRKERVLADHRISNLLGLLQAELQKADEVLVEGTALQEEARLARGCRGERQGDPWTPFYDSIRAVPA
jgi:hypothetical protein